MKQIAVSAFEVIDHKAMMTQESVADLLGVSLGELTNIAKEVESTNTDHGIYHQNGKMYFSNPHSINLIAKARGFEISDLSMIYNLNEEFAKADQTLLNAEDKATLSMSRKFETANPFKQWGIILITILLIGGVIYGFVGKGNQEQPKAVTTEEPQEVKAEPVKKETAPPPVQTQAPPPREEVKISASPGLGASKQAWERVHRKNSAGNYDNDKYIVMFNEQDQIFHITIQNVNGEQFTVQQLVPFLPYDIQQVGEVDNEGSDSMIFSQHANYTSELLRQLYPKSNGNFEIGNAFDRQTGQWIMSIINVTF